MSTLYSHLYTRYVLCVCVHSGVLTEPKPFNVKKMSSLRLIWTSICHACSNPGWNVSGRGVLPTGGKEQQVKVKSEEIGPPQHPLFFLLYFFLTEVIDFCVTLTVAFLS